MICVLTFIRDKKITLEAVGNPTQSKNPDSRAEGCCVCHVAAVWMARGIEGSGVRRVTTPIANLMKLP